MAGRTSVSSAFWARLVQLPPRMADSLGLAIHELVTNSIKYGALAVQAGRVRVKLACRTGRS